MEDRSDLLHGVAAIAEFLNLRRRVAQHRIDKGEVPTFRLGKNVCARRSTLNAWLAECEAKAAAERAAPPSDQGA